MTLEHKVVFRLVDRIVIPINESQILRNGIAYLFGNGFDIEIVIRAGLRDHTEEHIAPYLGLEPSCAALFRNDFKVLFHYLLARDVAVDLLILPRADLHRLVHAEVDAS